MPMPFERLRLLNPSTKPVNALKYRLHSDRPGQTNPPGTAPFTEDAVPGTPLATNTVHEFVPMHGTGANQRLYEGVLHVAFLGLVLDDGTANGLAGPDIAVLTPEADVPIREIEAIVRDVASGFGAHQLVLNVFYHDGTFAEFLTPPF